MLPTSGHSAEIKDHRHTPPGGVLQDRRANPPEWWLLESDAEHRITVNGDARQVDSAESPIARALPTSRLYLVQRGQHIDVTAQTLSSVDVLAAVVRSHERTIVPPACRGDLVADETLTYENNGIDYLFLEPHGRPIFLATDGKSERILHREKGAEDVMIPLRTGSHGVRIQSLAQVGVDRLFGRLELPLATYPLTASRAGVRLGLPAFVYPIAFLGGDCAEWLLDGGDALAVAIAAVVAFLVLRGLGRRILGTVVLAGLWFVAPPLFVLVTCLTAAAGAIWLLGRFLKGRKFIAALVGIALVGGFMLLLLEAAVSFKRASDVTTRSEYEAASPPPPAAMPGSPEPSDKDGSAGRAKGRDDARAGKLLAQNAAGGALKGSRRSPSRCRATNGAFTRAASSSRSNGLSAPCSFTPPRGSWDHWASAGSPPS